MWALCVVVGILGLAINLGSSQNSIANKDWTCHDPATGGTVQNLDRRFLIMGSEGSHGAGLGNLLIFFPAAYYFAAFTGRDILIEDNSIIGEMCKIVQCGFPFVSAMRNAFPGILNKESLRDVRSVKKQDFMAHISGTGNVDALVVRAAGFMPQGDWWVYWTQAVSCVMKISGCDKGDVPCAERHAFQRFVRGPFRRDLSNKEEHRVMGVPDNVKHAILTLPHAYAPRLDAAIHLRTQFQSFEWQANASDPELRGEVKRWLEGEECKEVFQMIEDKLHNEMENDRTHRKQAKLHHGINSATIPFTKGVNGTTKEPLYIYLASDSEEVKQAFAKILEEKHSHQKVRVMHVKTNGIVHVKNLARMKELTGNEGILDLVFDWYALSLSNVVLAWRKGGTGAVSTFVQSASRVSGTTTRTSVKRELGKGGLGTYGMQLQKNKRGAYSWNDFWVYGFLEDFRIPSDRRRRLEISQK